MAQDVYEIKKRDPCHAGEEAQLLIDHIEEIKEAVNVY